jgi:hypothetical protein
MPPVESKLLSGHEKVDVGDLNIARGFIDVVCSGKRNAGLLGAAVGKETKGLIRTERIIQCT